MMGFLPRCGDSKTSAIHCVHPHINHLQSLGPQHVTNDRERIILDVFVADGVVRVQPQHRWHVALFKVPQAVCGQRVSDVADELPWGLKVIKHCDRSNEGGFGFLPDRRHDTTSCKKIDDQIRLFVVILAELSGSGIHADFPELRRRKPS